jgi:hypothetical protein
LGWLQGIAGGNVLPLMCLPLVQLVNEGAGMASRTAANAFRSWSKVASLGHFLRATSSTWCASEASRLQANARANIWYVIG